ncbi:hypothetical protein K2P56_03780 [Patescibacteria group bacterium]|nr:hypothetical protein [Patescibacteria group bacterium]
MKKSAHAAEAREGAPIVKPISVDALSVQLKEQLVARFGEEAVASLPERRMWPKGRGI